MKDQQPLVQAECFCRFNS